MKKHLLFLGAPGAGPERFQWLPRLVLMILMIRFAFVVEVGLIAGLDKLYFDDQKAEAHSALQLAQQSLSNLKDEYQEIIADQGFVSGTWEAAGSLFGTEEQSGITEITASAVVELIVITLVRGLLLPLAFVWLLIVVAGRLSGLSHYPPRQPV